MKELSYIRQLYRKGFVKFFQKTKKSFQYYNIFLHFFFDNHVIEGLQLKNDESTFIPIKECPP